MSSQVPFIGTCGHCGAEMRYNVPRLGPNGGYVHKATGRFDCGVISDEGSGPPKLRISQHLIDWHENSQLPR